MQAVKQQNIPSSSSSSQKWQGARCIMVLGCTSGAGKSWLATALCRWYARQGYKVAPFKAQNMSNNARVVAGGPIGRGGEIGAAQYFQAQAAQTAPDVRMNPLLLKPESDRHSQVLALGQVDARLTALPWRERGPLVWPLIAQVLDSLRAQNDIVIIEGAGSPAEINLADSDVVNMRVARHAHAACLLVADIDRGGAFAHLYGTWALLPEADRHLLRGFVLNKFRGDASLLAPAPQNLQTLTGVPTVAILPMWRDHGLPEEDGVFDDSGTTPPQGQDAITIAIVAYPHISNLDEFQPLKAVPGVCLQWVRHARQLQHLRTCDWVVLPGSKNTTGDLQWLRQQGLDAAICQHAARGGQVLGICGGLQMLGEAVIDPADTAASAAMAEQASLPGLGLLPLVTVMQAEKCVRQTVGRFVPDWTSGSDRVGMAPDTWGTSNASNTPSNALGDMAARNGAKSGGAENWMRLAGLSVQGYEIHVGQTRPHPDMLRTGHVAQPVLLDAAGQAIGWTNGAAVAANPQQGNVLGVYLHGLFENAAVLQALFGVCAPNLDAVFERMADAVEAHFGAEALHALLNP